MKKLIIILATVSTYIESSIILKEAMDYTSPTDQIVIRKTNNEIRNSNIHKTLISYKNHLETNEGEDIDWNLYKIGFIKEDIKEMRQWLHKFYFDAPRVLPIVHPKLSPWIDNEFYNITNELALNLEDQEIKVKNLKTNELETKKLEASRLGPIEIRKGIIDFIMLKTNQKYRYIKHEHRKRLLQEEKNYKRNFLDIVNRYIPKFEYIESIDSAKITDYHDFDYLIVKAQDFKNKNQTILLKLNTILTNDPNITVIVAFDDNADIIDSFFYGPNNILNLVVIGPKVTSIGVNFLAGCSSLTSLDLTPLKNITSVGCGFLKNCTGLTSLDLIPLKNITSIDYDFLRNCTGLKSLDLTSLKNVTFISHNFLSGCKGLTSLDLTPLKKIKGNINNRLSWEMHIGGDFFLDCSNLKVIELSEKQFKIFLEHIPKGIKINIKDKTKEFCCC